MKILYHYILWLCRGYNFFSMCVINWIKCIGGWMTYCHKNFIKKKKKNKEGDKKGELKKNDVVCGQCTNAHKLGAN